MRNLLMYGVSIIIFVATSCSIESPENNSESNGEGNGESNGESNGQAPKYSIIASLTGVDIAVVKGHVENGDWEVLPLASSEKTRSEVDANTGEAKWIKNTTAHFLEENSSSVRLLTASEVSSDGKTATFTGSSALGSESQKLYGVYPATGTYQNDLYTLAPITFQDNTLNQIAMVAYPTAIDTSETAILDTVEFTPLYAAIGVRFKLPDDVSGKVISVALERSYSTSKNRRIAATIGRQIDIKAEAEAKNFSALESQTNEMGAGITILMPQGGTDIALGGTFEVYAKIYPSSLSSNFLNFTVTLADGRQLTARKQGVVFERGNYYKFKDGGAPEQLKLANNIIFSDEAFKTFLLNATATEIGFLGSDTKIDTDNDGQISIEEAKRVAIIKCSNKQLTSLGGVEHFLNLTELDCSQNFLSHVDVSTLKYLLNFNCSGNSSDFFALLHTAEQKDYMDNITAKPSGWNWILNNPIEYIEVSAPATTGQVPLTNRVSVQTQTATRSDIIDSEWVGVGINRPHAIQHDYSKLFKGKPSYRFELREDDNSLDGYNEGESKGRAELSYCYATDEDFRDEPAGTYEKSQIVKSVYHYGKGMSAQGASMKYQFSFYAPSALDIDIHSIFAQWHGAPTRTLAQNPNGEVVNLTVDEFIEMSKIMGFKNDTGYNKIVNTEELEAEPNGWLIEQGGYPPLAFGLANGVFYIKVNSDKKWMSDKTDRTNANSATAEVMIPKKSTYKESTVAYRMPFADFPKEKWITFNVKIDWTQYGKELQTIIKPGRLDVKMTYDVNGVSSVNHIVNNEEIMIGRNDEDGYYFKFGIYRTSSSVVPLAYNLAGYSESRVSIN